MSNTKSFRFNGTDEDWNKFVGTCKINGKSAENELSSYISQSVTISDHNKNKITHTASRLQDNLAKVISQENLRNTIREGKYHITISDPEFIERASFDLEYRIKYSVYNGIHNYWVNKMIDSRVDTYSKEHTDLTPTQVRGQLKTKILFKMGDKTFDRIVEKVKVTFDIDIPTIKLHELKETDLNSIIKFNCLVIGPSEVKMDIDNDKYVQKVLIQELDEEAQDNSAKIIKMICHGDDTGRTQSGKHLKVIGKYRIKEALQGAKATSEMTLLIDALMIKDIEESKEVTITKEELMRARETMLDDEQKYISMMVDSFCPKIFGRRLEKMALYLCMLGGNDVEGYRKESHLMLAGEADTAKSELVKFANKIAQKSSIIDGSNSTGVGVLFAMDEYDGTKILRAGAMILNNNGMLIVDEYDKMPKSEQKKLNQAMEQQRATYNKGGHRANAETKTTIIASCNPENERWNDNKTLIDNLPFDASTISRFDLLIRLKHDNHENVIRAKMEHIVKNKKGDRDPVLDPMWLKGLLNYLRKLKPTMNKEAEEFLIDKFVEFTQIEQPDGSLPIQTRQMEGIQRLCEAYAKLTFRKIITVEVVEKVILFYQECLATLGMNVEKGITQMDLRGDSINKDEFFDKSFKDSESEDGAVLLHDLGEILLGSKHFNTAESITYYMEQKKKAGSIYEPKPGVWKKQ